MTGLAVRGADDRHFVAGHLLITGDQGQAFESCLSNKQAIERVAVDGRQTAGFPRVVKADRELFEAGAVNELCHVIGGIESPQCPLYLDLPDRGGADQDRLGPPFDDVSCVALEALVSRPQQDVGVEQNSQAERP